jgi:hypothetical protein
MFKSMIILQIYTKKTIQNGSGSGGSPTSEGVNASDKTRENLRERVETTNITENQNNLAHRLDALNHKIIYLNHNDKHVKFLTTLKTLEDTSILLTNLNPESITRNDSALIEKSKKLKTKVNENAEEIKKDKEKLKKRGVILLNFIKILSYIRLDLQDL